MANIYLALNGDDVGTRIGEAIANDDHEGLAAASSAIDGAHGNIDQWVESVGGKKVTRSGDEAIYMLPEEALEDLESIRSAYKEQSGHGLTVGVGSSMSESAKALIYGKLNGKDQVVHYDPSIEDYLSDEDVSEDEIPKDDGMGDDQGDDSAPETDDEQAPMEPGMEDDQNADIADDKDYLPEDEESEQAAPGEIPEEGEEAPEENEGEGPDLSDDNQKMSESPASKQPPMIDEEDAQDPDAPGSMALDGDIDGDDMGADKDESEQGDQDEESAEAAPEEMPGDMNAAPEGDPSQGDSSYQDLNEDDFSNPEMNVDEQPADDNDPLTDMIHGDMEDGDVEDGGQDEGSLEDGAPSEDQMSDGQPEQSGLDEELRQDIAEALMAFKENKEMLEQAREQNPKLYQATITMLRSMIEMAKKLGQNPEQDVQDQSNEQQLNEEFPPAEDGQEGEQPDDSMDQPQAQPDMGEQPPAKKQMGKLQ